MVVPDRADGCRAHKNRQNCLASIPALGVTTMLLPLGVAAMLPQLAKRLTKIFNCQQDAEESRETRPDRVPMLADRQVLRHFIIVHANSSHPMLTGLYCIELVSSSSSSLRSLMRNPSCKGCTGYSPRSLMVNPSCNGWGGILVHFAAIGQDVAQAAHLVKHGFGSLPVWLSVCLSVCLSICCIPLKRRTDRCLEH